MKCFVALSKFGDIIQALPIIKHEFEKTGKKPHVITSEKFSSIFEGCSYIGKVLISPGQWGDLHGAVRFGKSKYSDVVILQCHGENFPFKHTKPSFQHEVYDRVGLLNYWATMKPDFDRRNFGREKALLDGYQLTGQKYILVADHSESSQFKEIEELKVMLATKFGSEYRLVMLSSIKAEKIFDLLGVYENAVALVSTESVHTHLAWATNVPMFVLAANGWRGSAMRNGFKFYIKYADWEYRKNDLIESLDKFLKNEKPDKSGWPFHFQTEKQFGYNLSSFNFDGTDIYTYRYHFGGWKTKLQISIGGKEFPLQVDPKIENHSIEDCRLFQFNGKLHGVYTVAAEINGLWKCYQAYGEITHGDDAQWYIGHIQIKYPGNDFSGTSKNWCPFVHNGDLHFIYGARGGSQVVLQVDHDRVHLAHNSPAPQWRHGEIRGGIVLHRAHSLLRFFHSRQDNPDQSFRYYVGCAEMEAKPPFKTLKVCTEPVLIGDDEYTPGCRHWKGNVVFALGAIQREKHIMLSYGHNDCGSRLMKLTEEDLHL